MTRRLLCTICSQVVGNGAKGGCEGVNKQHVLCRAMLFFKKTWLCPSNIVYNLIHVCFKDSAVTIQCVLGFCVSIIKVVGAREQITGPSVASELRIRAVFTVCAVCSLEKPQRLVFFLTEIMNSDLYIQQDGSHQWRSTVCRGESSK